MSEKLLLISDLDGTLLDGKKSVPENALRALERFTAAGGFFTVATGRTEDTCRIATDILPVNAPVILYNGASIMDLSARRVLYDQTLDAARFRPLVADLLARFPELCVELFAYGPLLLVNPGQIMDPYILRENQPYRMLPLSETPDRWLKIMLSAPKARLMEIEAYLDTVMDGYPPCSRFFSAEYYYELLPQGCSKGACAQWLSGFLQVPRQRVAAMGDHLNDLEILSWAGYGFAPSNAHERVKAVAQMLPATNDEGAIAHAVERLMPLLGA
ncbi:MAG: HAD hydrolase family protein [Clostridia bacterium]|nr:HAD hydrolase family protein [Clostridia bacterium]